MLLVLSLAAVIWGGGLILQVSLRNRLIMLVLLWAVVVLLQLALPDGHALRQATGTSVGAWLFLGGIAALCVAYAAGLRWVRRRAAQQEDKAEPAAKPNAFTQTELSRYARHIVLREIGGPGQRKLKNARVLVVGAGGLGSPALLYLAASGVGQIGVIDDDLVEGSNLQRQVIHTDDRIGVPKVFSAEIAIKALNPFVTVKPYHRRLTEEIAQELFEEYDLILDGTDNFDTRYLANSVAYALGKPLVSGALSQWEGQITVFDTAKGTPCYQCIFPERPAPGLAPTCADAGVFAPLPGIIGTMMAAEAVKVITGAGESLRSTMVIHDALYADTRRISLKPRADCSVCGDNNKDQA